MPFGYAYESKFRSRWDRSEQTDSAVVLRCAADGLDSLPYDLLQAGRRLLFNLGEIFPNLSYPVLANLDRADLDALYEARRHAPSVLGDNDTKEFILRHVFEVTPELIRNPSDLLRVLLRRHHREQRIPALLDERLIQLLRRRSDFDAWPLDKIVRTGKLFSPSFRNAGRSFSIERPDRAAPTSAGMRNPTVSNFPAPRIYLSITMTFESTSTTCSWKGFFKRFPTAKPNRCRRHGSLMVSERTSRQPGRAAWSGYWMSWTPRLWPFRERPHGMTTGSILPGPGRNLSALLWNRMRYWLNRYARGWKLCRCKSMPRSCPGSQNATRDWSICRRFRR